VNQSTGEVVATVIAEVDISNAFHTIRRHRLLDNKMPCATWKLHLPGPCCKVTLGLGKSTQDPLHLLSDVVYFVEHKCTVIYRPDILLETLDLTGKWCGNFST
jgi:hypothetical protein